MRSTCNDGRVGESGWWCLRCLLWTSSVGDPQLTGGRTILAQCTQSTMPIHFAVKQHPALVTTQEPLEANEWILAFLDDICILYKPERVGAVHAVLQEELFRHDHIRINGGETHVWNAAGVEPVCESSSALLSLIGRHECVVQTSLHTAKGSCLGCSVGHPDFDDPG